MIKHDDKESLEYAMHLLKVINKDNFWDSIDSVMKWLYKFYPEDMKWLETKAKNKRDAAFDKFGRARDDEGKISNDMRNLGLMPSIFGDIVSRFYGDPLKDSGEKIKFYRTFFKKYPQLKTVDKI